MMPVRSVATVGELRDGLADIPDSTPLKAVFEGRCVKSDKLAPLGIADGTFVIDADGDTEPYQARRVKRMTDDESDTTPEQFEQYMAVDSSDFHYKCEPGRRAGAGVALHHPTKTRVTAAQRAARWDCIHRRVGLHQRCPR